MGIQTSLDTIRAAERLVDSMRLADDLAFEASRDSGLRTIRLLCAAIAGEDHIVAIAATHALAQTSGPEADAALTALLDSDRAYLREHAAWAMATRIPQFEAVGRLIGLVSSGGFVGMLAQRTLEHWCLFGAIPIAVGLESALLRTTEPAVRLRLVETLGLIADPIARGPLLQAASDDAEGEDVRVAAIAALGDRRGDPEIADALADLSCEEGEVGAAARLACVDLAFSSPTDAVGHDDLTIVQLFLHADIDPELSQSGSGDNGGIATLLVHLGDALTAVA
ncbi:MAG: HEAT repeat domain-containing protein, partial [Microbacteriaceae bacterium]